MLKFSGFADLTSCLVRDTPPTEGVNKVEACPHRQATRQYVKTLFKLLVAKVPIH